MPGDARALKKAVDKAILDFPNTYEGQYFLGTTGLVALGNSGKLMNINKRWRG
ncbi:UNVERIFIED_CONTAM: hypothetical protein Sradi_2523600 [Sesamum radiatum]|uniref:Uncharacterized protein n=1 Tax=Sesamum radiatum TaxID=300843 RepID=A0AAW2SKP7_SESRA